MKTGYEKYMVMKAFYEEGATLSVRKIDSAEPHARIQKDRGGHPSWEWGVVDYSVLPDTDIPVKREALQAMLKLFKEAKEFIDVKSNISDRLANIESDIDSADDYIRSALNSFKDIEYNDPTEYISRHDVCECIAIIESLIED